MTKYTQDGAEVDFDETPENPANIWEEKFIDPDLVGCTTPERKMESEEGITDVFSFMAHTRNNFFSGPLDNECCNCSGSKSDNKHRPKCAGCSKDPFTEISN